MAFKSEFKPAIVYDSPEAMFHDIRNRSVQGLLSHQTDMLREYMEQDAKQRDIAFELPTGSGKTLVGLLIAEYRRRTNNAKVVYLCPTRQLVNQVVEQSKAKYGIKTAAFTGSQKYYNPLAKAEYNNSEVIAVTTYSSLFNTSPFFINPDLIILDDAHSAENYIASFWSMVISRSEYPILYRSMVDLLVSVIPNTHYQRLISDSSRFSEDYFWVEKVPTPELSTKTSELVSFLDVNTEETNLKFTWSILREHLQACHVYLSWNSILIRPVIPPSLKHPPFANAKQRIYMSATLGAGGDLERITGVKDILRLPIPTGWDKQGIGRRFFLFPEAKFPEKEALTLAKEMCQKTPRALVLVPDEKSVEKLTNEFQKETVRPSIFHSGDLEGSKSIFTQNDNAVAILANRLDGIDLNGDECRLLIVKGLPRATNLQEKFLESRMAASVLLQDRIRTRIVQAIGRCTRSATDFSAICILGQELMDVLSQKQNLAYFHPELQGELTFGFEESINATPADFLENLQIFLNHGEEWNQVDTEIMARRNASIQVFSEAAGKLLKAAKFEVDYQYAIWDEDYERALLLTDKILEQLQGDDVRGYRGFWYYLAGSAAWLEAQNGNRPFEQVARERFKQAASCTSSVTWLRNLGKLKIGAPIEINKYDDYLAEIIEGLEKKLSNLGVSSGIKFEKEIKFILENLNTNESTKFEEAHKRLGQILGYVADNSEVTAAPDPWWIAGDQLCIVAEDKTEGDENPVSVNKTRQAASHPKWIRDHITLASNAEIIPIMITNGKTIDPAAIPFTDDLLYWHIDDFRNWAKDAIAIVRKVRASYTTPGDIFWRSQAMQEYKDAKIDPENLVLMLSKQPLKNLPRQ